MNFTLGLDALARTDIRAPQDGIVQALKYHTPGGVIAAGDGLMELVPDRDDLTIDVIIPAVDIDQVHSGVDAEVRFPSFHSKETPVITGVVETVSPDAIADKEGKRQAFSGKVSVTKDGIPPALLSRLQAGMPAEVYVATEKRTVLGYFTKPLLDAITHGMREK